MSSGSQERSRCDSKGLGALYTLRFDVLVGEAGEALALKVEDGIIFNALLKREELGSTGVGNGVAIPHVRLEQVKKPFGILVRLREPIDFDSVDEQRVDLVCLVLLAKGNEGAQPTALASVARRLRTPTVLQELRRAPNRVVLYNVMMGRAGQSR